jgi:3-phenylpropionate/trans-cinnamate dioxygenase ferredoxin reductase subunit
MPLTRFDVVVVGAGHAGAQLATSLRQERFAGTIALIGDEPDPPYERPPLTKEYLSGEKDFDRLLIRPIEFWTERDVALLSGQRVTVVEPDSRRVRLAGGDWIEYGHLVWAAGGAPRKLACEGHHLAGLHTLRTRSDADRLRAELATTASAVVIGGGYIGLEAAAVLAKAGKQVTVLEAQDRVLARVAGEPLSRFFESEHRAHGVNIRLNVTVAAITGSDGRVAGVRLADGEVLACDMVIVGIGIVPAIDPLRAAGADCENGVLVDRQCRTSLPDVFAIGDCAMHSNRYADGAQVRLESVQNANDQARIAAKVIAGSEAVYEAPPWFWSNQYDLKLQTIGLSAGHDAVIVRGNPTERSFSLVYLKQGRVLALDCVNATRDYAQGKRLVVERLAVLPELLADVDVALKDLAPSRVA